MRKLIVLTGVLAIFLPAQAGGWPRFPFKAKAKKVTTDLTVKPANASANLSVPSTTRLVQPVDVQRTAFSAAQTPRVETALTPSPVPAAQSAVSFPDAAQEISYFHRWGKEGTVQDVYSSFAGDPYAAGQREIKRLERIVSNGVPSGAVVRPSGFELQLRREADAPTRLLSDKEMAEFRTTVLVGREAYAAQKQPSPRKMKSYRKWIAENGFGDPYDVTPQPYDAAGQAGDYEEFDVKNYLAYEKYPLPFNPNVQELEVLAASDDVEFLDYLVEHAQKTNSRVHITLASSGNEAIGYLKDDPTKYQVVLTDISMLNGTGKDIARYVLKEDLPCYTVTMSKDTGDPAALFFDGFDGALGIFLSESARAVATTGFYGSLTTLYRPADEIFAYLSNLVGQKGHAFPQGE